VSTGDLWVRFQVLDNIARVCPVVDKCELEIGRIDAIE
jgi:hypothetical protein